MEMVWPRDSLLLRNRISALHHIPRRVVLLEAKSEACGNLLITGRLSVFDLVPVPWDQKF
jgi:hypothetical protein